MNELSLFSGAGGGLLGTTLLEWNVVGYVEYNEYCQRVIAQRIRDGMLPNAPIFGDIRTFRSEGYAAAYTGMVDVVTGGFPCQPFSVAGKQFGADDPRNMWPATIDTIRTVRPRFAFLENVPGLLTSGYFGTVVGDLAESGYDCRWRILSAAELGAPHKRDRLWIVAHACSSRFNESNTVHPDIDKQWHHTSPEQSRWTKPGIFVADCEDVAYANSGRFQKCDEEKRPVSEFDEISIVAYTNTTRLEKRQGQDTGRTGENGRAITARSDWWNVEPGMGRVANGVANRVDRLRAIGNGQVPAVVRTVWHLLTEGWQ